VERIRGVEGIRALAASALVVWHVYIYATPGGVIEFGRWTDHGIAHLQLGLWAFFCLSAFLLYRPFAAAVLRGAPQPDARRYLRARALRILPAYWVILTFVTFVAGVAIVRAGTDRLGVHLPTYLADLFLVQSLHPRGLMTGIGPAWSLSVEAAFYLALPVLGLGAALLGRRARTHRGRLVATLVPAGLLLACGVVAREIGARFIASSPDESGFGATWYAVWDRSILSQADLFAAGMIVAVLAVEIREGRLTIRSQVRPLLLLAGTATLVAAILALRFEAVEYRRFAVLAAFAIAMLVAAVVLPSGADRSRVVRALEARPIHWLGEVSYSVFLWHYPVVFFLVTHDLTFGGTAGILANVVLVFAVTVALAAITFRYVERPFLRRKVRRPQEPAPEPARAASAPSPTAATP
jgi:peptidoglycan/LPS O-acetylase OafA/YrhL